MISLERVKKISTGLQTAAIGIAALGLLYRATVYWTLALEPGAAYGVRDIVDFLFALALFLVCTLCTVSGVAISVMGDTADKGLAFRAVLVGILSFMTYEFLHDHLPRLM